MARVKNPSAALLLRALDSVTIKLLERVRYETDDSVRKTVRGMLTHSTKTVRLGRVSHTLTGGAADLVDTLLHELIHFVEPQASEATVARWTKVHYTNPELRAQMAIRLLDLAVFGEAR